MLYPKSVAGKPVATPARVTSSGAPSVAPKKATAVKTEKVELPPPCSSFTPVKSPAQKRSKSDAPAGAKPIVKTDLAKKGDSPNHGSTGGEVAPMEHVPWV